MQNKERRMLQENNSGASASSGKVLPLCKDGNESSKCVYDSDCASKCCNIIVGTCRSAYDFSEENKEWCNAKTMGIDDC